MNRIIAILVVCAAACSDDAQSPGSSDPGSTGTAGTDQPGEEAGTDAGSSCLMAGADCSSAPNGCCNGAVCISDTRMPDVGHCAVTCLSNTQCASGCCATLASGTAKVCSPPQFCSVACTMAGGFCANGEMCCPGSICVASTVDGTRCADTCIASTQCVSGCCAPLDNQPSTNVCSPATFCSCVKAGGSCAAGELCCAGTACVAYGNSGTYCGALCTAPAECASGCCAPVPNKPYSVCAPPQFCGL